MIVASDQGTVVTVDGGKTWSSWYNQPTAQFYHVATDDRFPYWIYGAQQDSGAAATPVRTDYRSITERDWKEIAAGGENGYIVPDPADPDVVWGGTVARFHWQTLQNRNVDPTLAVPDEYRGEWTLPLAISHARPEDGLVRERVRLEDGGRRPALDEGEPRPHARERRDPAEPRPRHGGGLAGRRAAPQRRLRDRALAARGRARLVRHGRRPRLAHGGRWRALGKRDAEGAHAVVEDRHPRGVALRRGNGLRRGRPPPARRRRRPHLQNARRGTSWTSIAKGIPGRQLRQRRAGGPRPARTALRRDGDGRLRLLRRRRELAAAPAEPPELLDPRPRRESRRPRRRDARPVVLGPRRRLAAAADRRGGRREGRLPLRAARRRAPAPFGVPGHARAEGRADGGEPAERRRPRLFPEGAARPAPSSSRSWTRRARSSGGSRATTSRAGPTSRGS